MNVEYLWETYAPDFQNNRDLPKKEQFTVDVRPIRTEQHQALQSLTVEQAQAWVNDHCPFAVEATEEDLSYWQSVRCVHDHSRNWRGLSVEGEEVDTVWGLYKLSLGDTMQVLADLNTKILDLSLLSEEEEKNLPPPSDGSTVPAAASDAKKTDS